MLHNSKIVIQMMNKKYDTIKKRLQHTKEDVVGDFYSRLRDSHRTNKRKLGEIQTSEGLITLSCNTHFYYLDDCAITSGKNSEEMYDIQRMLFNLFYYLYGDDFKVDESCYGQRSL